MEKLQYDYQYWPQSTFCCNLFLPDITLAQIDQTAEFAVS